MAEGRCGMAGRALRRMAVVAGLGLLAACASLPPPGPRPQSHAFADTQDTALGRFSARARTGHAGRDGLYPLADGVEALFARLRLADMAQRSLDVQYYIWHNDLTGRLIARALLRAADRGVRVRILLDDIGARARDDTLLALDAHPGVEVRLFNPVAERRFRGLGMMTEFARINRRMHNKAFIADNQAVVTGGRNIGDEYFEASGEVMFGDLDVLAIGPVVARSSAVFDAFWSAPAAYPITALTGARADAEAVARQRELLEQAVVAQRDSAYAQSARQAVAQRWLHAPAYDWGEARVVYDAPDKIERPPEDARGHLMPQLAGLGRELGRELLIVSPYFIPGDAGVAWLRQVRARGVRVVVLTNSLASTDVGMVHSAYRQYREALLAAGVELYEFRPEAHGSARTSSITASRASLHAKTFVFDRQTLFIGSLNLDPRSTRLNTESGLVCDCPALAGRLAGRLLGQLDRIAWRLALEPDAAGKPRLVWIEHGPDGERRYAQEPQTGALRRMSVWLLGLLPLEGQL